MGTRIAGLVLLLVSCFSFGGVAFAQFDFNGLFRETCHYLNFSGSLLEGYGVPYDVFAGEDTMLYEVFCRDDSALVRAGDGEPTTYIYNRGYVWKNGGWQPVTFSPQGRTSGSWLVGEAEATIPFAPELLDTRQYLVGYICQYMNRDWKCGCKDRSCSQGTWQLQTFSFQANTVSSAAVLEAIPDELKLAPTPVSAVLFSPRAAGAGTSVTVQGHGLNTTGARVAFKKDGRVVATAPLHFTGSMAQYQGAGAASFIVPNLAAGLYRATLQSDEGNEEREHFFVVSGAGSPPAISSFSPTTGAYGSEVTLYGSGFTEDTIVYDTYGGHRTARATNNGTRLTFSIEPYAGSKREWYEQGLLPTNIPIYFYTITNGGFSNTVGPFNFR